MSFVDLAPYILPPVVGACIGYLTNWVAIRMLFRPLTEKRLFGIRIPFTPGIIPNRRDQLANSIGRMVEKELFVPEALQRHLDSPTIRQALESRIGTATARLLAEPLSKRVEHLKQLARGGGNDGALGQILTGMVGAAFQWLGALRVGDLAQDRQAATRLLASMVNGALRGGAAERLLSLVDGLVERSLKANRPIKGLVGEEAIDTLLDAAERLYPHLLDILFGWLQTDTMQDMMTRNAVDMLNKVLDRLNFIQRGIISLFYKNSLLEQMPQIMKESLRYIEARARGYDGYGPMEQLRRLANTSNADIETHARENDVWNRLQTALRHRLHELWREGLADATYRIGIDLPALVHGAMERIVGTIRRLMEDDAEGDGLEGLVERLLTEHSDTRLDELVNMQEIASGFSRLLDDLLGMQEGITEGSRPPADTADSPSPLMQWLQLLLQRPLAELLSIDEERKGALDRFLVSVSLQSLRRHMPALIASFDIHRLVVNRIDSLEVEQVEMLIKGIISRELKWINLFGALLGALIGGVQILLTLL